MIHTPFQPLMSRCTSSNWFRALTAQRWENVSRVNTVLWSFCKTFFSYETMISSQQWWWNSFEPFITNGCYLLKRSLQRSGVQQNKNKANDCVIKTLFPSPKLVTYLHMQTNCWRLRCFEKIHTNITTLLSMRYDAMHPNFYHHHHHHHPQMEHAWLIPRRTRQSKWGELGRVCLLLMVKQIFLFQILIDFHHLCYLLAIFPPTWH